MLQTRENSAGAQTAKIIHPLSDYTYENLKVT